MTNFVQREQYRFLQDQLIDFVTNETFDVMIKKFNTMQIECVTKEQLQRSEEEMRKEVDDKLILKLSISDFNEELTKFDTEIHDKF